MQTKLAQLRNSPRLQGCGRRDAPPDRSTTSGTHQRSTETDCAELLQEPSLLGSYKRLELAGGGDQQVELFEQHLQLTILALDTTSGEDHFGHLLNPGYGG